MLTQTSEYALRAMVYLARKGEGQYAGVKEIAQSTEVPFNYLAKILQVLARGGVLESQKGFGGGFRIGQRLSRISLLDVVDPLENISKFRRCVLGQKQCSDETACPLHAAWKRISNEYLGSLKNTTLQDVADFKPAEKADWPGAHGAKKTSKRATRGRKTLVDAPRGNAKA